MADFSSQETVATRRSWDDIFKIIKDKDKKKKKKKDKDCQTRMLQVAELPFKSKGEIKTSLDNKN